MCDRNLLVSFCGRKLRRALGNSFSLKLAMCVCAVFFRYAKCDRNFARFFTLKDTNLISHLNDDFSEDFFNVYYVSVRLKLEILRFLPMFFFILTFVQY